jgi:hypothetical protein
MVEKGTGPTGSPWSRANRALVTSAYTNHQEGEAWFVEGASYESQSNFHDAIRCYDLWREFTPGPDARKATVDANESKWREHGVQ